MELYAAGSNAWNQLRFGLPAPLVGGADEEPDDVRSFTCVLRDTAIGRPRGSLSHTAVETARGLLLAGDPPPEHQRLRGRRGEACSNFAEAMNGSAISLIADGGAVRQYPSLGALLSDRQGRTLAGLPPVRQAAAYSTGFAALSATGQVWTWGDERYGACLGRDPAESPAGEPGLVAALEDLPTGPIEAIAAGGYTLAALTEGRDLYVWRGRPGPRPGADGITAEPTPVVIEDHDIVDVAVGELHLIVLTASEEVFVIGENGEGQLGLEAGSVDAWTRVDLGISSSQRAVGVAAGPFSSFVLVQDNH